jgi:hypothetical protein
MKKYFINYAARGFKNSQQIGLEAAKSFGFNVEGFNENNIDESFYNYYSTHFQQPRGAGYWLWKPYIIKHKLSTIEKGDYLIYMDSGGKFIKDPTPLLSQIDKKGFLTFNLNWKDGQWTKGNIFDTLEAREYRYNKMILTGCIMMKKSKAVEKIIDKWLHYCSYYELVSDTHSDGNFPEFIENRHDQSIFSLLVHKHGLKNIPQIDQYRNSHGLFDDEIYIDFHGVRE